MIPARVGAIASLLLGGGGCDQPTALLVRFVTDGVMPSPADGVDVAVASGDAEVAAEHYDWDASAKNTLSLRSGALPEDATVTLRAAALLPGDALATRAVVATFAPGEDRDLCVVFDAGCVDLDCGDLDCRAGGCLPVTPGDSDCLLAGCASVDDCDDLVASTEDRCGADGRCTHTVTGDLDGDGWVPPEDCDDADADIHPDRDDPCDGVEQNCDPIIDGVVVASTLEASARFGVRISPDDDGFLVGWTEFAAPDRPEIVIARADARSPVLVETLRASGAGAPTFGRPDGGPWLVWIDSRGVVAAPISPDGSTLDDPITLLPIGVCDRNPSPPRPTVTAEGDWLAVGARSCAEEPAQARPFVVLLDTGDRTPEPVVVALDTQVAWLDPSVRFMPGGVSVVWSNPDGVMGTFVSTDGSAAPLTAAIPGYAPALFGRAGELLVVFNDPAGTLVAVRVLEADQFQPVSVLGAGTGTFPFAGEDTGEYQAVLTYGDARPETPEDFELKPSLLVGDNAEWTRLGVHDLLAEPYGGAFGDVAQVPDGQLLYAEQIGELSSPLGLVVVASLSCVPREQ